MKWRHPFGNVVKLIITMGGNSIYKELPEAQGYDMRTATTSAFIQQRDKILPCAFEFLLHEFTEFFPDTKTYRGHRPLAADGYDLNISIDTDDLDTYYQNKGYSMIHLD